MRHGSKTRKFGRETKQRQALMRSLLVALITSQKITTTRARAKSLRPSIEKLVTKSRGAKAATIRLLEARLPKASVSKLVKEIAPKYTDRPGGYTRIRSLPARTSDGAPMAIIEFV